MLYFASPFFEAALSGDWAETGRPQSMSSVITIPQPPIVPGENHLSESSPEIIFAPVDPDLYGEDAEFDADEGEQTDTGAGEEEKVKERKKSLDILQSGSHAEASDTEKGKLKVIDPNKPKEKKAQAKVQRRPKSDGQDAVIVLKEEKVKLHTPSHSSLPTFKSRRPASSMIS